MLYFAHKILYGPPSSMPKIQLCKKLMEFRCFELAVIKFRLYLKPALFMRLRSPTAERVINPSSNER